ncbi:MAG: DUF302 domain-containing protein [Nitrospinae bacterium]|nr:DUF302 domain-containing protein [Nitrospinota bacterium]
MKETGYGISKKLSISYDEAEKKVREKLKEQGFGVLTEIDVKRTVKEKLNADFRRYVILGACNPPFAHQALSLETEIGLMMPCNVIVYEPDDGGSVVAAIDPAKAMGAVKNDALRPLAASVRAKLVAVINAM